MIDEGGSSIKMDLKNPALYGKRQQRIILANAEKLRCTFMKGSESMASSNPTTISIKNS